jgi:CheY-like chemotaxis protein
LLGIWLDEDYDSGVEGSPGARFVIQLKAPAVSTNKASQRVSLMQKVKHIVFDDVEVDNGDEGIAAAAAQCTSTGDSQSATAAAGDTATGCSHPVNHRDDLGGVAAASAVRRVDYMDATREDLPENLAVLFVDDDPVLRKLFSRALKRVAPSWTIKEAVCGEACLRLALGDEESHQAPQHFDLIWMDQYMPSTERPLLGTETIRLLRDSGIQCRICGLSANALEESFIDSGADCFMLKPMPCAKDELKRQLLRVLGIARDPSVIEEAGGATHSESHADDTLADAANRDSHAAAATSTVDPATGKNCDDNDGADATNAILGDPIISSQLGTSDKSATCQDGQNDGGQSLPENMSVLFVDDDPVLRKLFSRALKRVVPSWTIKEAVCGEACLKLVLGDESLNQLPQHFDLIWMDQYMPSMTERPLLGTETVQLLRASGIQSRICGLSANAVEEAFMQAGADCFMLKLMPCGKVELKRQLFRVLGMDEEMATC